MRLILASLVLTLIGLPALAQTQGPALPVLAPASWTPGELTTEAAVLEFDSTYVEEYTLVSDGSPFEVRLISEDFDTYLIVDAPSGEQFINDDYAEAWGESRVVIADTSAEAGTWTVRVNTLMEGETGAYVLAHAPLADRRLGAESDVAQALTPGGWLASALTPEDRMFSDSTHFKQFTVVSDGSPFEVRLTSFSFDPYLPMLSPSGVEFSNDDYEGSLYEARIVITDSSAEAGTWTFAANSYGAGATGEFIVTHRTVSEAEVRASAQETARQESEAARARVASLRGQAAVLFDEGKREEALAQTQEALALQRTTAGEDTPEAAELLLQLGQILNASGERTAARDTLAKAIAVAERALGERTYDLAPYFNAAAQAAYEDQDIAAAGTLYERVLEVTQAAMPPRSQASVPVPGGPPPPPVQVEVPAVLAVLYFNLATVRAAEGNYDKAIELFESAALIEERALGAQSTDLAVTLVALGAAQQASGEAASARASLERALAIQTSALETTDPARVQTLVAIARLEAETGDHAAARTRYEEALALQETALGVEHPETAVLVNAMGELVQLEAFAAARPLYERALAAQEAALGDDDEATVRTRNNLARLIADTEDLRASAPPSGQTRGGPDVDMGMASGAAPGPARALLFATDEYDDEAFADLANPVFDAEAIAGVLGDRYGFETEVVRNPTRDEIYARLGEAARASVADGSRVMVFFAGHGTFLGDRERGGRGYLIPRDADADRRSTWINYSALADELDALPDSHVLLVLDVCYGGSFVKGTRGGDELYREASPREIIATQKPLRARLALTSGALEYVSDGIAGQHSPFAYHLLEGLRAPNASGLLLFEDLVLFAKRTAGPTPVSGRFGQNLPGSTFYFIDEERAEAARNAAQ